MALLQEAGLTGYAARAYLTLFRLRRSKVMPLARASGIPRNKLYHVLEDLTGLGLAERVSDEPLEYAAKSAVPFVEARIQRMQELLQEISRASISPGDAAQGPAMVVPRRGED